MAENDGLLQNSDNTVSANSSLSREDVFLNQLTDGPQINGDNTPLQSDISNDNLTQSIEEDDHASKIEMLKGKIIDYREDKRKTEAKLIDKCEEIKDLNDKLEHSTKKNLALQEKIKRFESLAHVDDGGDTVFDLEKYQEELNKKDFQISGLENKLEDCKKNWELRDLARDEEIRSSRETITNLSNQLIAAKKDSLNCQVLENQLELIKRKKEMMETEIDNWRKVYKEFKEEIEKANAYFSENKKGRFFSLKEYTDKITDMSSNKPSSNSGTTPTLSSIASQIEAYGKSGNYEGVNLRFEKETICAFLAGMGASEDRSRLILLQGLSGTGKSSLPQLVASSLGFHSELIPVQPSWRDRSDLVGFENDFKGVFKETDFTKAVCHANLIPQQPHFIILDECNLARIEYYFADFLSLLEKPDGGTHPWKLELVSTIDNDPTDKYRELTIPKNLWFIGTANIDESTQSITDKVYDRAQVLTLDSVPEENTSAILPSVKKMGINTKDLHILFKSAVANPDYQLNVDDQKIIKSIVGMLKTLDISFGERVVIQMQNFVPIFVAAYGGDVKLAKKKALDYFIANKLLICKLDKRFSIRKSEMAIYENLSELLKEKFGENSLSNQAITKFTEKYR